MYSPFVINTIDCRKIKHIDPQYLGGVLNDINHNYNEHLEKKIIQNEQDVSPKTKDSVECSPLVHFSYMNTPKTEDPPSKVKTRFSCKAKTLFENKYQEKYGQNEKGTPSDLNKIIETNESIHDKENDKNLINFPNCKDIKTKTLYEKFSEKFSEKSDFVVNSITPKSCQSKTPIFNKNIFYHQKKPKEVIIVEENIEQTIKTENSDKEKKKKNMTKALSCLTNNYTDKLNDLIQRQNHKKQKIKESVLNSASSASRFKLNLKQIKKEVEEREIENIKTPREKQSICKFPSKLNMKIDQMISFIKRDIKDIKDNHTNKKNTNKDEIKPFNQLHQDLSYLKNVTQTALNSDKSKVFDVVDDKRNKFIQFKENCNTCLQTKECKKVFNIININNNFNFNETTEQISSAKPPKYKNSNDSSIFQKSIKNTFSSIEKNQVNSSISSSVVTSKEGTIKFNSSLFDKAKGQVNEKKFIQSTKNKKSPMFVKMN